MIGDTVATGTTLCGTIKIILERIAATGKPYPDIYVWAIAGSISVAEHPMLLEIDALLKANGKKLHLYFANARFNLNENGTDLQFFDADYNERAEKEIKAKLGAFLPKMRCAVWDWGDRFREIRSHLEEIKEFYEQEKAPKWLLDGINSRLKERGHSDLSGTPRGSPTITKETSLFMIHAMDDMSQGLVENVKEKLGIKCVNNDSTKELFRGIRTQLDSLLTGLPKKDLAAMKLGLAHSLGRYKLKFSPDKVDVMIIQSIC